MLALVVYDIADTRRRTKLSTLLEGYGRRVQESVFECFLSLEEMRRLYQRVYGYINTKEDNVRFYWITEGAMKKSMAIGSAPPEPPPSAYFF
ncbi:MAG: CRISPR-associated endonuclease Cas2 [Merismopedia sp. SIO2A8]|nr:CRISPR-associated endonuclease Cas2 [Merismopedia sp. SIO2A8]